MTATCATVKQLTKTVTDNGRKLYMDKFFSFSVLYNSLTKHEINCLSTSKPSLSGSFQKQDTKLKEGDIQVWMSFDVTAVAWKCKNDVQVLTNIYNLEAEGNCGGDIGNALRPAMVDHNTTWITSIIATRWLTAPLINYHMWKWTKKRSFCQTYVSKQSHSPQRCGSKLM
jgi:hypothetical protein